MSLFDYMPGAALGIGLWLGLRWPGPAVKLAALLGVVIALALNVIAGMPDDSALLLRNQGTLAWSVIPSLVAFLVALAFGRLLRGKGGGGME